MFIVRSNYRSVHYFVAISKNVNHIALVKVRWYSALLTIIVFELHRIVACSVIFNCDNYWVCQRHLSLVLCRLSFRYLYLQNWSGLTFFATLCRICLRLLPFLAALACVFFFPPFFFLSFFPLSWSLSFLVRACRSRMAGVQGVQRCVLCVGVWELFVILFCRLSDVHAGLHLRLGRVAELCGRACTRASC